MKDLKAAHEVTAWRALQIYTLYRIVVSGFLLVLFQLKADDVFLGQNDEILFHWTSIAYFLTSVSFFALSRITRIPFHAQVELQVFLDIILIALLMHASGGVATGLGMLMAVSVTTACLLLAKSSSLSFAAIATAVVIGEAVLLKLTGDKSDHITQAGLLGATFFATSLFALLTAQRLKQSELEAEATSADLASMEKLNESIIQFMKTGVIALDSRMYVQFINTAAWELLEMPDHVEGRPLHEVSEELEKVLSSNENQPARISSFRHSPTGPRIQITQSVIKDSNNARLLFLEDTTEITQQAQNLKLASLGRLTASIAHEIRNPLGALSHATQLLEESQDLPASDIKLLSIIQKNAVRMNTIIENVMQLSQRRAPTTERVEMLPFLTQLIEERKKAADAKLMVVIDVMPDTLKVPFDRSQLMQVVNNLVENGLRYSFQNTQKYQLRLTAGFDLARSRCFLEIIDKGEGIEPEKAEKIFEPFFTTSPTGTGLGLYISKELCEANRASLDYIPVPSGGSCFRVTFAREHIE
ncbi:nitrogen regulation protein NR(II) [Pleionea sp. CnH1-48]|uniref:two-component system sensor histidine kinase NtrB n=1 Tax=Pleionea sp. CnH1-48 TaxID=2954494 RepID=UPI002096F8C2|nr:ATP-binding protein [Pleionea sp. CnH1-48]MCO7225308.1 ATP-binding protein [Pleionea sp. CnH1-48]